jgi:predicted MFS family arabinose efflux permease
MRNNGVIKAGGVPRFSIQETFASLRYPNYRLWFIGQLVSMSGTWMQSAAQGFLVYELTKSPAFLGYVSAANGLPSWLFTLYAGAIADRVPRRTLIVITQSVMMLLAFVLALLTFTGLVQPWHIIVLAFLLGICNAFDAPARQAFLLEMVDRDVLTNAIALNSAMFTSAVVIGPAVGGLAYAWVGPEWCFTLNGLSYIAVIAALLLMKLKPMIQTSRKTASLSDIKEGLAYVLHHPTVRMLIANLAVTTIFGLGIATLVPAWAVNVLHGDSTTNGFLLSARGIGSLIGALMIAALGMRNIKGRLWTYGSFVLPIFLLIFSAIRVLPPALLAMAGIGWGFVMINNVTNAMVQTQIVDEMRGRVMGIYTLVFFGSMPIGSFLAGNVAEVLGEPTTAVISAFILLAFAFLVLWRTKIKEIK